MVKKINRQECLDKHPKFPQVDHLTEEYYFPKVFGSYILTIEGKSVKGKVKLLSAELVKMITELGIKTLIFLGDSKLPWLYQDNNYKSVKEALQYLIDSKIGKRFNGALEIDKEESKKFSRHVFWLARCNAAFPLFYFMDEDQNILGNICQYGNLHISSLNKRTDKNLRNVIIEGKFEHAKGSTC